MKKPFYVKADAATEARERARVARERLAAAADDYDRAFAELDRVVGPDPRKAVMVEQAIAEFCATVTGRPSVG